MPLATARAAGFGGCDGTDITPQSPQRQHTPRLGPSRGSLHRGGGGRLFIGLLRITNTPVWPSGFVSAGRRAPLLIAAREFSRGVVTKRQLRHSAGMPPGRSSCAGCGFAVVSVLSCVQLRRAHPHARAALMIMIMTKPPQQYKTRPIFKSRCAGRLLFFSSNRGGALGLNFTRYALIPAYNNQSLALGGAHSVGVQRLNAQSRGFRFRCRCRDGKSALQSAQLHDFRGRFAEQRWHSLSCYEPGARDQARKKTVTFFAL